MKCTKGPLSPCPCGCGQTKGQVLALFRMALPADKAEDCWDKFAASYEATKK